VSSAIYDVANELTNWNGTTIGYDASGNIQNDGLASYTWNARNQLTGRGTTSFQYDASGRRTLNAAGKNLLYEGWNVAQELSGTTPVANQILGGVDEFFSRTDSTGATSPIANAVGSVLALTNSAGNITAQYGYDPFGNTTSSGGASTNVFQYTGRENDGNGLYFYRARYYSPQLGRFISEDPIGFGGGFNFYSYAGNDPISWIDPFGLADVYVWKYRGSTDAWGHSSVDINNGDTHISWWPQSDGREYTFGDSIPIYDASAYPNQTLANDSAFEGQGPDFVIHLDNLDESAMAAWWRSYRRSSKWKTFGRNCSTTVAHALEAGGGDRRVRGFPKPIVWTPEDVKQYALAIQAAGDGSYDYPVPGHTGLNNK
jgi:RHS repeat-associated protein